MEEILVPLASTLPGTFAQHTTASAKFNAKKTPSRLKTREDSASANGATKNGHPVTDATANPSATTLKTVCAAETTQRT